MRSLFGHENSRGIAWYRLPSRLPTPSMGKGERWITPATKQVALDVWVKIIGDSMHLEIFGNENISLPVTNRWYPPIGNDFPEQNAFISLFVRNIVLRAVFFAWSYTSTSLSRTAYLCVVVDCWELERTGGTSIWNLSNICIFYFHCTWVPAT